MEIENSKSLTIKCDRKKGRPFVIIEFNDIDIDIDNKKQIEDVEALAKTVAFMLEGISNNLDPRKYPTPSDMQNEISKKQISKLN